MAHYFRNLLEAWNFRHLLTDEDTEMDAMIAEMDLSQFSTPGSSQIEVLMVEPADFGQELDQSDAYAGGATASFNANAKANDDQDPDQSDGDAVGITKSDGESISLGKKFETTQQIKKFMSNLSKQEGFSIHFNKQKKPGKYSYYIVRVVCAYKDKECITSKKNVYVFRRIF